MTVKRGRWPDERETSTDPLTGVRVTQLTRGPHDNNHLYFTSASFSADGSSVLFVSNRTGSDQLHTVDLRSGEIRCHTSAASADFIRVCRSPQSADAYYFDGRRLMALDLDIGAQRELLVVPAGYEPSQIACSASSRFVTFAYREDRPLLTGRKYVDAATNDEMYFQRVHSVLMVVDAHDASVQAVWGEAAWIEHPQFSPVNDNLLLFCHAGQAAEQRMWLVERAFRRKKRALPFFEEAAHERAVHEYFLPNGDIGFQLYEQRGANRVMHLAFMSVDGGRARRFRSPAPVFGGHMQANADSSIVVFDKYPARDVPAEVAHHTLSLMALSASDGDDAEATFTPLCGHGTSWSTQRSHCHPIFSPDGSHVLFTSDRTGHCHLYLAEVGTAAERLRKGVGLRGRESPAFGQARLRATRRVTHSLEARSPI